MGLTNDNKLCIAIDARACSGGKCSRMTMACPKSWVALEACGLEYDSKTWAEQYRPTKRVAI